ncbi:MAG: YhcH/YjgK/YiaL family protein [Pseudodesulfovibrio sp.]
MILDTLENIEAYASLNPNFATAFAFLRDTDLAQLPIGKNEIDGDKVYAVGIKGPGRKPDEGLLETHDKYIDIQLVLRGVDTMGWKARKDLGPTTDASDPRNDVAFYSDKPDAWTVVKAGMFAIYFPEDAHLPMISDGELHKVVVKIKV